MNQKLMPFTIALTVNGTLIEMKDKTMMQQRQETLPAQETANSFYTASGTSPTETEWIDVCDYCGEWQVVKKFCDVYCIEGHVEQVLVCRSCMVELRGGQSHE